MIEILSPSTVQIDRSVKFQLYARHGVPHYWIVDLEARTIEAYRFAGGAYERAASMQGSAFPALALDPASLWP